MLNALGEAHLTRPPLEGIPNAQWELQGKALGEAPRSSEAAGLALHRGAAENESLRELPRLVLPIHVLQRRLHAPSARHHTTAAVRDNLKFPHEIFAENPLLTDLVAREFLPHVFH